MNKNFLQGLYLWIWSILTIVGLIAGCFAPHPFLIGGAIAAFLCNCLGVYLLYKKLYRNKE